MVSCDSMGLTAHLYPLSVFLSLMHALTFISKSQPYVVLHKMELLFQTLTVNRLNATVFSFSSEGKYLVLPSGELHIRDVGPEDGYKSYQCRTKHRLTGETRLSATKGRLVITGELFKKNIHLQIKCHQFMFQLSTSLLIWSYLSLKYSFYLHFLIMN